MRYRPPSSWPGVNRPWRTAEEERTLGVREAGVATATVLVAKDSPSAAVSQAGQRRLLAETSEPQEAH